MTPKEQCALKAARAVRQVRNLDWLSKTIEWEEFVSAMDSLDEPASKLSSRHRELLSEIHSHLLGSATVHGQDLATKLGIMRAEAEPVEPEPEDIPGGHACNESFISGNVPMICNRDQGHKGVHGHRP